MKRVAKQKLKNFSHRLAREMLAQEAIALHQMLINSLSPRSFYPSTDDRNGHKNRNAKSPFNAGDGQQ